MKPTPRVSRLLLALGLASASLAVLAQGTGTGSGSAPGGPGPGQPTGTDPTATQTPATPRATSPSTSRDGMRSDYNRDAWSLLPGTRRGYVGINLGQSDFDLGCGLGPYGCDNKTNLAGYVYTGGLITDWVGMELGYLNTGRADRAGGRTRAQGVNLSAVFRVPVGPVNLFAKGGVLYGQTRVSTGPLSTVTSGSRRGFGGTFGAGVGFDFTPSSGVVLEWMRSQFKFPGSGREDVDTTMIGYVHRF